MCFPLANELAQQNDPIKKYVLARHMCISYRVGPALGKEGGHCTQYHFSKVHYLPVGIGQRL